MKRVNITLNNDMTFVVEKSSDGSITSCVVMGTDDNVDYNDVVVKKTTYFSEEEFVDEVTTMFDEEFAIYAKERMV